MLMRKIVALFTICLLFSSATSHSASSQIEKDFAEQLFKDHNSPDEITAFFDLFKKHPDPDYSGRLYKCLVETIPDPIALLISGAKILSVSAKLNQLDLYDYGSTTTFNTSYSIDFRIELSPQPVSGALVHSCYLPVHATEKVTPEIAKLLNEAAQRNGKYNHREAEKRWDR